jgi:hypothetical protein
MMILLFILSLAHAQVAPNWQVVSEKVIAAPADEAGVRQLPIDLMIEQGSKWGQPAALKAQLEKTSKILRQCGVVLGEVRIQNVVWTPWVLNQIINASPYKGPKDLILMRDIQTPVLRTLGFLYGLRSVPSTAAAYNRTSVGRLSSATVDAHPLVETFHITEHHMDYRAVPGANATYDTFAHELVHLMGDVGHIDVYGNLMSGLDGRNSKTGSLTAEQCELVNQYPLISQ